MYRYSQLFFLPPPKTVSGELHASGLRRRRGAGVRAVTAAVRTLHSTRHHAAAGTSATSRTDLNTNVRSVRTAPETRGASLRQLIPLHVASACASGVRAVLQGDLGSKGVLGGPDGVHQRVVHPPHRQRHLHHHRQRHQSGHRVQGAAPLRSDTRHR